MARIAGQCIGAAWNRLILASRAMDAEAAEQEYTDLFVGVGKSPVNLHASHWLTGFMMERPLAQLRADLARAGTGPRGPAPTCWKTTWARYAKRCAS